MLQTGFGSGSGFLPLGSGLDSDSEKLESEHLCNAAKESKTDEGERLKKLHNYYEYNFLSPKMTGNVKNKSSRPVNVRFVANTSDIRNLSQNIRSVNPLLWLQTQVAKLQSELFYYLPLLGHNKMVTYRKRFTSSYGCCRFAACYITAERRQLGM